MPDKLTDNEIVKALECCANCESCDYETTDCPLGQEMECRSLLAKSALDLINRLQEKKEALINGQETLQKHIAEQKAEIEKWQGGYMTQKQEIANLEIELKAMRGAANSYKAEVERLTKCRKEEVEKLMSATDKVILEAKSEAYKEFAERLIGQFKNLEYRAKTNRKTVKVEELKQQIDWVLNTVAIETINNLLKKLVGEE